MVSQSGRKSIVSLVVHQPHHIFLLDGIGAVLSLLLLLVIVAPNPALFGLAQKTVVILALPILLFSVYSLSCFFIKPDDWQRFLSIIMVANLLYCLFSFILIIYYRQSLKPLGISYFLGEIIVIIVLVRFEWQLLQTKIVRSQ